MQQIEDNPTLPNTFGSGPHVPYLSNLVVMLSDLVGRMVYRLNRTLPKDGTEAMTEALVLATYTVATRPTASDNTGGVIYVSDGGAGAVFQGSDGTSWVNLG